MSDIDFSDMFGLPRRTLVATIEAQLELLPKGDRGAVALGVAARSLIREGIDPDVAAGMLKIAMRLAPKDGGDA